MVLIGSTMTKVKEQEHMFSEITHGLFKDRITQEAVREVGYFPSNSCFFFYIFAKKYERY